MKVLIVGSQGMLGTDLTRVFVSKKEDEIVRTDRRELDITDIDSTIKFVAEVKPEIVINCSAYTNVDGCESDADNAYKINAMGVRNLAVATNEVNAAIVHISTDYVFDGEKGGSYLEHDKVNPLNVYGETKWIGEEFIRNHCSRHYIARTQWLFGNGANNFVTTMMSLAKRGDVLTVVNDQFGCPTYTVDLANAIHELIRKPEYGTYHITNSDIVSWYDFTHEILEQTGAENITVNACESNQFQRPAKRPKYSPLENYLWRVSGHKPLRGFKEALSDYLKGV